MSVIKLRKTLYLAEKVSIFFHVEGVWESNQATSIPCAPATCPEYISTDTDFQDFQSIVLNKNMDAAMAGMAQWIEGQPAH